MIDLNKIIATRQKGPFGHPGNCSRCGEFGRLSKSPWTDPYTGTDGWGWLCPTCFEQVEPIRTKYGGGTQGKTPDLSKSYNPVPKPLKKKKKTAP